MNQTAVIDILKQAILLERRGRSFYNRIAESAGTPAVRRFFQTMADEEAHHIHILTEQYRSYLKDRKFSPPPAESAAAGEVAAQVLSADVQHKIEAAGFEAAAVSAAMAMEKEAITLYADRAEATEDPGEKALYRWLSGWESTHLAWLADIDQALKEKIWQDNSFWPF